MQVRHIYLGMRDVVAGAVMKRCNCVKTGNDLQERFTATVFRECKKIALISRETSRNELLSLALTDFLQKSKPPYRNGMG